ncbi:group I truncated hemoglobin [Sulfoacidibacillus thermotolerans]|uniref:Group 1 truncated hemoglobin n=1 Tax=Sulfoacidibacillus thermotolerans TaxID=1765684 RepID=A0A2U3D6I6_SULT2|nr:group 1 truncated hemoglobin [Sulfoacidibacillus thermotolerans]PWI56898.1 group 1 truncated hemoglobin [Sulfoacidibacillus thermotolerans]
MGKMSLYDRLGGQEGIIKVVDQFYDYVLADGRVNHFFRKTDMKRQRLHQSLFISFATGGPNHYTGQSMRKAHEGMNLTDEHFDTIVELLARALRDFHVAETEIVEVANTIEPLRKDIVGA